MTELTTDRVAAYNKNKTLSNGLPKKNNVKIMTEAQDNLSLNNQQKEIIIQENTTNRNIFTNDDNYEINERIRILKQIVDKAPKLNLEEY